MKRFLLVLWSVTALADAQEVVVPQSAWGAGAGVEGSVAAIAVQSDGKVLVGGNFLSVNGVPRNHLARLNSDGTLDRTFVDTIEAGVNGPVLAIAVRPDGGIVVGGTFSQAAGTERLNIALYKPDGSLDPSFATAGQPGANGSVAAIAAQPDGKVVIGGAFTAVCGQPRMNVARINADGSLDEGPVTAGQITGPVSAAAALSPSASLVGGAFRATNQQARSLFLAAEGAR